MRCIFCKKDSSSSVSVEHVIPESLGNKTTTLPKGAVCDACNNYFASKVEKPVLESGEFIRLRFHQQIENKKGRIPETEIFFGKDAVRTRRKGTLHFRFNSKDFATINKYIGSSGSGQMIIPTGGGNPPSDKHLSRLLAKMGLEALSYKWMGNENWNAYVVDHEQLDFIRNYARKPKKNEEWKYSKRRIYDADSDQKIIDGIGYQVMNEWDILVTGSIDDSEFYFVVAIFGVEYAINLGGNSMDGYNMWLEKHNNASPLYVGKNAESI